MAVGLAGRARRTVGVQLGGSETRWGQGGIKLKQAGVTAGPGRPVCCRAGARGLRQPQPTKVSRHTAHGRVMYCSIWRHEVRKDGPEPVVGTGRGAKAEEEPRALQVMQSGKLSRRSLAAPGHLRSRTHVSCTSWRICLRAFYFRL